MKQLYVANLIDTSARFLLPIEAITNTFIFLGQRNSGKTHAMSVMAEEMLKQNFPPVIYDPVGVWWGLKSSADGKSAGFSVVIFGGEHADVPLESRAGELIAETIVDRRIPAIIDCKLMRKGERRHFMADFLETLYRLNRKPLHLFCDEVHTLAPQNIRDRDIDANRCLGAIDDIILQGRNNGLGFTGGSQRPALVNTNIRTQCATLMALRIMGPHDIKAVKEWVEVHADLHVAEEMLKSLPTLKKEAWVWSPEFLECFQRIKFRPRETFDSSAGPKIGQRLRKPTQLAKVDIAALGEQIAAKVEEKRSNDPQALKSEIARLRAELAKQRPSHAQSRVKTIRKIVKVAVPPTRLLVKLEKFKADFLKSSERLIGPFQIYEKMNGALMAALLTTQEIVKKASEASNAALTLGDFEEIVAADGAKIGVLTGDDKRANDRAISRITDPPINIDLGTSRTPIVNLTPMNGKPLSKGPIKLLQIVVGSIPRELTDHEAATIAGFTKITTQQYLRDLRKAGLIIHAGKFLKPTADGIAASGITPSSVPHDPAKVREMWLGKLPQGPAKLLSVLIEQYPNWLRSDDLQQAANFTAITTNQYLRTLRQNRLVDQHEELGSFRASPTLFEMGNLLSR
jgi:hypothetical protein